MTDCHKTNHVRHQFSVTGSWDYTVSKTDTTFQIDFGNSFKFQITPSLPEHQAIQFLGAADQHPIDSTTQAHLIRNQITPMIRAWKGSLVFHASAVSINDACWGFIGNSGAGKSTLAKSLSNLPPINHWCDDWLEVQEIKGHHQAIYNSFSTRLEYSHAQELVRTNFIDTLTSYNLSVGNKLLINRKQDELSQHPRHLDILCEIDPCIASDELSIERLKPTEAFQCISRHLYRLDTTNPSHMQREFIQLTKVVEEIPIYRMLYPHSLENLQDLHATLIDTFSI